MTFGVMKHIPLITALILASATISIHAQTPSILVKTGDTINVTTSNSATLRSFGNVTMNDLGGIAFQGYATETNRVTNSVTITNFGWTTNFVPSTNRIVTRIVTNVINTTNTYTLGGSNYSYTNTVPQYGYQTNLVVTNRPVLTRYSIVSVTNRVTVSYLNYSGIWASDSNGAINLLIRSGQVINSSQIRINSFTDPVINNNGAAAFIGYSTVTNGFRTTSIISTNANSGVVTTRTLTNPITSNTSGIYLALQGSTNPIQVATIGSAAPGTTTNFTSFSNLALPDVGGVIFVGMAGTNQGVWVQNPDSSVQLVALRGQSIAIGGTNKVIRSFNLMNYGYPGVTKSFSQDTGVITYQAWFTDGTSAAVRVNR